MKLVMFFLTLMLSQGVYSMEKETANELKKMGATVEENPQYPQVISYKLKNGLKILMLEKNFVPTVSYTMMFKVGNVDNIQGQTGLAHMFEHMAFKGTANIGTKDYEKEKLILDRIDEIQSEISSEDKKELRDEEKLKKLNEEYKKLTDEAEKYQIREELWKIYNELGQHNLNAFTSNDYTGYVIELPVDRMEAYFKIESDRFKNPAMRDFYKERDVVHEELRMYETNPNRISWDKLFSNAFIAHPYHNPVIGFEDDVSHLLRPNAFAFYQKFYVPNNATLAIVGDIDPVKTIKLAEKYFADWKASNITDTNYTKEPKQIEEKIIKVSFPSKSSIIMGFKNPGINSADMPALIVAADILANGSTSRLYKSLVEEKNMALYTGAYASTPGDRYPSLFVIASAPKGDTDVQSLDDEIMKEISEFKNNPPTQWEIDKVINNYQINLIKGLESNLEFAQTLAYNEQIMGNWKFSWNMLEKIKMVRSEDVVNVVTKYLTRSNRTTVYIVESK
ncbi:MAG: insulinase family protein [Elusimicrobiales bacterium]|nr:insulinase family protein [Elusimicrobiales bacterium]